MLNAQDEDYEKRLERARQLRNSVGMVTNNDKMQQSTNNNNMSLSNGMDYEQKLQRAKKLRNSIGMITSRDIQNTDISKKSNITNFPNIDNNSNISITTDEAENKAKNNDVFSEQKKENKTISIQKPKEVKTDINTDITVNKTNIPLRERETKNTLKTNTPISIASNVSNQTKVTSKDVKAMNEAEERNKQIEKGGIDAFNATAETILKNIQGGAMSTSAGLANVATTAAALGVKGLESWAHVIGQNKAANSLNDLYNNIVEAGSNIKSTGEYQSNITGRIENEAVRTAGQVTNTVSEMATNALIGYVLPGGGKLSTAIQGLSVGGRSAQEVLDENPDKIKQATLTGLAKGYTSYLTEKMFDANILTKGQGGSISDKVDELVFKNIKSKFGKEFANKTIGIIGENIEELAEDNIGNIIDKLVNDKDFPTIQEWWNNTAETAKVTTLSTIVMSLLGLGGGSFENKESDIMTRKVQKIIDDGGYAIQYNKDEVVNNSNKGTFYTTTFNQEGEVESINTVQGKPIENPNKKVNVTPAIILNNETNTYNVIDSNTGVLLDTTPYSTLIQAQTEFTSKMINLDEATIKGINSKVSQSNIAINNKINEVITQAENELNNTSQNVSNGSIATSNDNTSNYTSINQKDVTGQNNVNLSLTMEQRTNENVSNQNINSYQFEHPEVREEIQGMASMFLDDLSNSTFGERYKIGDTWSGQKRSTTRQLAQIKDETKATWNQISQALTDISEGKGNYALAKKIELILDDALTNGYTNIYGKAVVPNESYLTKKETIEGINYRNANTANNTFLDEEDYRIFGLKKRNNLSPNNQNANINNLNKNATNYIDNNQESIVKQNRLKAKELMKSIKRFSNAKKNVAREDIINIANALNAYHKNNQTFIDKQMSNLSNQNKLPEISTIKEFFTEYKNKMELRKLAGEYALREYKNESVLIKDINTTIDISQKGIKKTFNIKQSIETLQTAAILPKIISESIYLNSSIDLEDKNFVYHYFYSPVKINEQNALSMITIKEIVTDKKSNPKFYYHDIREIKSKELLHAIPQQKSSKMLFEETPSIDNSISQKNNSVKNDTAINNKSMQKSKNNANSSDKNIKDMKESNVTATNSNIQTDSQGRELSKKQQEYFKNSKVRDDKGNLLVVYHGTNNSGFTKFKRNINYFTSNKEVAQTYTGNEGIYEGYINIENPIVVDANNEVWSKINIENISIDTIKDIENFLNEYGASTWREGGKVRTSTADLVSAISDAIDENVLEADGIIIKNIYDEGAYGDSVGKKLGDDYITFISNQFKNIDNKKPTKNEDIRYLKRSKLSKIEENTLIAQHNTSEEKLLEALDLGALPVPSIAITKYQSPISNYGNITLLFNKDTINPTDKRNVTYNSDIYSTRKPQIANALDKEKVKTFEKIATDNGISYGYLGLIEEYVENNELMRARDTIKYELQKINNDTSEQEIENVYSEALKMIKEKRILKPNIDPYTPSGNKKTIQQMSIPYTLENIIQIMTKKNTKGSESNTFAGLAEIRANLSQKFKSIKEMHNNESNLISSQEIEKLKNELNETFYNLLDEIGKYDSVDRYFGSSDIIANAINETAKSKNVTVDVLDNELDYVSIKNVPKNILQKTVDFLNSLKNVPTEYFESKPQRAVGFNEVKKAIVPMNTSKEIINKLTEKGVEIEYYETQEERSKKISNNKDIRFSKKSVKSKNKNVENARNNIIYKQQDNNIPDSKTNAERADSWVEQEIQKVEKNGNWDDSIPVTKRSDIRRTIENYLGLGVKKGKFRQQAYGIYKSNRDVIRTKELKDMDTILHETGHALDLGNRLNIDKESIADELLTAIDKLGGYENESRTVKLDEGFAEVIREYAIIPEQAKIDYPQTIAVLENIKKNDVSFNNFITKVQQQTYNYIHQNPRNRVLSNQSIGEQTDKQKWSKAWIEQEVMRNIYDKDYALKKAVNTLAEIGGKTSTSVKASNNAYLLTRLSSGIGQKVTSMLSNGYIDTHGNKLMPGLNQIGEILGNNPERYNDLRAYLVAQRDLEYKAKTLKTGIRTMDSKAVVEQFRNDTEIQQAAKIVYDTLDGVLQYAVDNRLITQENADALRESNAFYVPMHRVLENRGNQVGKRGAVVDIIKKRTGSELDVKDVLENIIVNSSNIIQQVENNNILKALYNQGEAIGLTGAIYDVISTPMQKVGQAQLAMWENELRDQGIDTRNIDFNKTVDIFAPNNKTDMQNKTTSFINDDGKRVYLQFNDELIFNSIMNMDKKFMSQVLKINSKLNMPLRYGATMANIGFAIPNMISDTAQAAIYSTAGFIPVIDNALGVLDVLAATNSKVKNFVNNVAPEYAKRINTLYALYEQSGAMSSTRLSQYRESSQNIMKDVYGTKNSEVLGIDEKFKPLKRLLDLMTYIPELSEQSTRFRVFERNYDYYKNKGTSETDTRIMAAIESRDATQDFGRTGNFTREINQLIPFSAARVGSIYTFTEKVKSNPKQVGMRIAILTAIAMAIKGMGYDDKEIEELNQRKKDDNFVLKLGDSVVTIKKPQGILRSIVNLAEYIQDLATGHIDQGKEGERLGEWINNAIMDNMPADSLPGLVPNSLAPLIENAVNKDFYYNTDIVKSYDLDLPDSQQYYDYNSQLAILLGKIFNYSPAKIDNLISGYFGGLGTQTTNILDYIFGKLGLSAEKPEMGVEQNAVGKRFIVNVNTNSASIDEIYNRKTELTKKKNGGTITENETKELERLTEAVSNISNINKQIRSIKSDLSTSGEEKSDLIRPLQEQKTDTARKALGKEIIHSENITKIESTKFYPSRNTLSQNGYTLNLTEEMKKEYETLAYSNYQKYEKHGLYSKEKLKELESRCKNYAKGKLMQKYKSKLVKLK